MKKLLLLILISLALSGKGNEMYLFTDTKETSGQPPIQDAVTWIFNDKSISLITETQDAIYNVLKHEKVLGLITTYNKYYLENGYAVYVNAETLEVIFTTETSQYIFRVNDNRFYASKKP